MTKTPTRKPKVVTVKAWAVINRRGTIQYVSVNSWDFHLGLFKTKKEATDIAKYTERVVSVTLTYKI